MFALSAEMGKLRIKSENDPPMQYTSAHRLQLAFSIVAFPANRNWPAGRLGVPPHLAPT